MLLQDGSDATRQGAVWNIQNFERRVDGSSQNGGSLWYNDIPASPVTSTYDDVAISFLADNAGTIHQEYGFDY